MITLDQALAALRRHERELKARGVLHAAVFGSVARGDAGPDSDVDILVDLAPNAVRTVLDYAGLRREVAALLALKADVIDRAGLKPRARTEAERDAVYAF